MPLALLELELAMINTVTLLGDILLESVLLLEYLAKVRDLLCSLSQSFYLHWSCMWSLQNDSSLIVRQKASHETGSVWQLISLWCEKKLHSNHFLSSIHLVVSRAEWSHVLQFQHQSSVSCSTIQLRLSEKKQGEGTAVLAAAHIKISAEYDFYLTKLRA